MEQNSPISVVEKDKKLDKSSVCAIDWQADKGFGFLMPPDGRRLFVHRKTLSAMSPDLAETFNGGGIRENNIHLTNIETRKDERGRNQVIKAEVVIPDNLTKLETPANNPKDPEAYYSYYVSGRGLEKPSLSQQVENARERSDVVWLASYGNYDRKDQWMEIYSFFNNSRSGALSMLQILGNHGEVLDRDPINAEIYLDPGTNDVYMFTSHAWTGEWYAMKNVLAKIAEAGNFRNIILVEGQITDLYMPVIKADGNAVLAHTKVRTDSRGNIRGRSQYRNQAVTIDLNLHSIDATDRDEVLRYNEQITKVTGREKRFVSAATEARFLLYLLQRKKVLSSHVIAPQDVQDTGIDPDMLNEAIRRLEAISHVDNVSDVTVEISALTNAVGKSIDALVGTILYVDGTKKEVPLYVGDNNGIVPEGAKTLDGRIIHPDITVDAALSAYVKAHNAYYLLHLPEDPVLLQQIREKIKAGLFVSNKDILAEADRLIQLNAENNKPKLVVFKEAYEGAMSRGRFGNAEGVYVYINGSWQPVKVQSVDLMRYNTQMTEVVAVDGNGNRYSTQLQTNYDYAEIDFYRRMKEMSNKPKAEASPPIAEKKFTIVDNFTIYETWVVRDINDIESELVKNRSNLEQLSVLLLVLASKNNTSTIRLYKEYNYGLAAMKQSLEKMINYARPDYADNLRFHKHLEELLELRKKIKVINLVTQASSNIMETAIISAGFDKEAFVDEFILTLTDVPLDQLPKQLRDESFADYADQARMRLLVNRLLMSPEIESLLGDEDKKNLCRKEIYSQLKSTKNLDIIQLTNIVENTALAM